MSYLAALMTCGVVYLLARLLNLGSPPAAPTLHVKDRASEFVSTLISLCPILTRPYIPTVLWGRNGHIQTVAYAKMGRPKVTIPAGVRHSKVMADGSTLTFDLYEAEAPHKTGGSYLILFVPGIGNSSESTYMQMLVRHSTAQGYSAAVLNHLGALRSQPLTAPRIFTYGGTEELAEVRLELHRLMPDAHLILIGLSMGANIVVKYLGEKPERQSGILAAASFCQGYDLNRLVLRFTPTTTSNNVTDCGFWRRLISTIRRACSLLQQWDNGRYGYMMAMTLNMKKIMRRHKDVLFTDEEKRAVGLSDESSILGALAMTDMDELYTRKKHGFKSLEEFYKHNSCSHYMQNIKSIPLLVVNARDDPIIPETLLDIPREAVKNLPNCIFVVTEHGGHLGYFEDTWVRISQVTWMDRACIEFSDAVSQLHNSGRLTTLLTASSFDNDDQEFQNDNFVPGFADERSPKCSQISSVYSD